MHDEGSNTPEEPIVPMSSRKPSMGFTLNASVLNEEFYMIGLRRLAEMLEIELPL